MCDSGQVGRGKGQGARRKAAVGVDVVPAGCGAGNDQDWRDLGL